MLFKICVAVIVLLAICVAVIVWFAILAAVIVKFAISAAVIDKGPTTAVGVDQDPPPFKYNELLKGYPDNFECWIFALVAILLSVIVWAAICDPVTEKDWN